ncbi:MAG: LamG-like jellyroll fold domain-containing protein, partial [Poseidonia sp.]
TTVNFNNCDGCSFTNATLEYPSTSKRGLGIAGESEDDRWMTRFYRSKNSFVDKISITNTDGGAIEFHGSGGQSNNNTVNNSYFHAIDWSAADQKGLMTTIYEGGRDMYFTNNSVHLTGASSVLSIGDAPKVFYNEVWDVGYLQTDGAVVQVMQGEAPGAEIAYNWIHDVIKYGARFDAPIGQAGEGRNGTMHHNVIWNAAGGLMVKGDYHDIHNNTVFNSTGKNDIIFLTDGGINNKNSTLHYNAVDAMADHRSDDIFANPIPYGTDWMNWNGYIQGKQDALTTLNGEINSGGWVQTGYTCIINSTKSLLCWGYNANGQLGLGNTTHQSSPVAVAFPNAGTVEKVAESGGMPQQNCAIMTNGSLYCWGKNSYGELGIGSTTQQTTPQLVNLGSGVKAVDVSVGDGFTCAVTDAGALMCWGTNGEGRLGIGNTTSAVYSTPQTANLPTNRKAVDVQLGRHFGYALLDNGDVVSWGYNHVGYLGTGNKTTMYSPTVISLDSQRQVVSMSGGKHHGCIGYDNGSVVCTGRDNVGQQGRNTPSDVNDLTFSYTNALANLSIIAFAGKYTSCALLANGTAQCWGGGAVGQMGNGTTGNFAYPDDLVNTPSGRFIVDMSMSGDHACIVLDDGSVACWGRNNAGQLGLGNTTNQYQPVVLTGLDDLSTTSVYEMLVDPANNDFRPKWGSHLHVLNAGAYDADDSNPWTAGISWNYTAPDAPVAGCMLDYADNYDADATLSDGSCLFASYTPPSTLDLRLHLDPTNSSSYSGSGTNVADLSGFNNNGTVAAAGPTWDADFTRFTYDGACTGSGPYICDEVNITDSTTLRPGEPYEDLAAKLNPGLSYTKIQAPSTEAGYWVGGVETSFTIQAWLKPTDCETASYATFIQKDNSYSFACTKGFLHYALGSGTGWYGSPWVNTSVPVEDDVWQHVAFTRSGSSNPVKVYLNGVLSFTASSSVSDLGANNSNPLVLGGSLTDSSGTNRYYGLLDDVRI